ncbi:MAG: CHAT domain-containing protein, partial [Flavobacteriales bacterium]
EELKLPEVNILMTHGDLGNARYPVMVGHHQDDDELVNAEYAINQSLDGKLKTYFDAGIYPKYIRNTEVILTGKGHFRGAVVVGLGRISDQLTKGNLESTVEAGLLDLAIKQNTQFEKEGVYFGGQTKLGVSILLIGSSYAGLTIENSVLCILNAVQRANAHLLNSYTGKLNPITEIEFIELFEDRAITMASSVWTLLDDDRFPNFKPDDSRPFLHKAPGRKRKIGLNERDDWWYRLQIVEETNFEGHKTGNLKFTSLTEKASSEIRILNSQKRLIDKLVKDSVDNTALNEKLAMTLYSLIVPNELKDFASDKRDILLLLDEESAGFPWELLFNPFEKARKPLVVQSGLVRNLALADLKPRNYFSGQRALVIGNPDTNGQFSNLPAARDEALWVKDFLTKNDYTVEHSIESDYLDTITKFMVGTNKIIHIAAHGVVNYQTCPNTPPQTGVVLSEGTFITPKEINNMSAIPEFVFVNCCYSGELTDSLEDKYKIENEFEFGKRHQLAASLGTQFIKNGVKAVIVTGWAVDDAAAQTFAQVFYNEMFDGVQFGEAVRRAREEVFHKHEHTNTWGAYQAYGSQAYSFYGDGTGKSKNKKPYIHAKQARVDIKNVYSSTDVRSHGEASRLKKRLNSIIEKMNPQWLNNPYIIEALGSAYYELQSYNKSFHFFLKLQEGGSDKFALQSARKLSNLSMKLAREMSKYEDHNLDKINRYTEKAHNIAKWLLSFKETGLRLSLAAGNYKRHSLIHKDKMSTKEALKASRDLYKKSYKTQFDNHGKKYYYPLFNWITMEILLSYYGEPFSDQLDNTTKVRNFIMNANIADNSSGLPDSEFWTRTSKAARSAFQMILPKEQQVKAHCETIEEIVEGYKEAWIMGGSLRKAENILEQYN